jgi:hypothetical protein
LFTHNAGGGMALQEYTVITVLSKFKLSQRLQKMIVTKTLKRKNACHYHRDNKIKNCLSLKSVTVNV